MRRHKQSDFGSCSFRRDATHTVLEGQSCCAEAGMGQPNTACASTSRFHLMPTGPTLSQDFSGFSFAHDDCNNPEGAMEAEARVARRAARTCCTHYYWCLCAVRHGEVGSGVRKGPPAAWQECLPTRHGRGRRIGVSHADPD